MAIIGVLDILLKGDSSNLDKAFDKSRGKLNKFQSDTQSSGSVFDLLASKGGSALTGIATKLGASVVGFFAVKHVLGEISSKFDEIAGKTKLGNRIGLDVNQMTAYSMAFKKAGLEGDALETTFGKMQKSVAETAAGGGAAADSFNRLGLSAGKLSGMGVNEQFRTIVDSLAQVKNQGERMTLAFDIFGRGAGVAIATGFANGSKSLDEMQAKMQKFGLGVSPVDAQAMLESKKAFGELSLAMDGIWNQITIKSLPIIIDLAAGFRIVAEEIASNKDLIGQFDIVASVLATTFEVGATAIGVCVGVLDLLQASTLGSIGAIAKLISYIPGLGDAAILAEESTTAALKKLSSGTELIFGQGVIGMLDKQKNKIQNAANKSKPIGLPVEPIEKENKNKPLTDLVKKLKEQADTYGLTSRASEIYKAAIEENNPALIKQAEALDRIVTAQEVQKAYLDLSPLTKAGEDVNKYNIALKQGAINQAEYNELIQRQGEGLTGITDPLTTAQRYLGNINTALNGGYVSWSQYSAGVKKTTDDLLGFDSSPLTTFGQRQTALDSLLAAGLITLEDYTKALNDAKTSILGVSETPASKLGDYTSQIDLLGEAWRKGKISADDYWESVAKKQADAFGVEKNPADQITDAWGKINNLQSLGLTDWQFDKARKNALPDYIKGLVDETETPLEKYKRQFAELQQWNNSGGISDELFRRKALGLKRDLIGENKMPDVAEFGSAKALEDIFNFRNQQQSDDPIVRVADLETQSLEEQRRQTEELKKWNSTDYVIMAM